MHDNGRRHDTGRGRYDGRWYEVGSSQGEDSIQDSGACVVDANRDHIWPTISVMDTGSPPEAASTAVPNAASRHQEDEIDSSLLNIDDPRLLEASFLETIEDTTGTGAMQPFIDEFAKMQQALMKSHESETRFVNKCRELANELQETNERAKECEIRDIDNRRMYEATNRQMELVRETQSAIVKEIADRRGQGSALKAEISELNKKLETWSSVLFEEQQKSIGSLEHDLNILQSSRDKSVRQLIMIRQENASLFGKIEQLENEKSNEKEEISDLQRRAAEIESTCKDEYSKKAELEEKTNELKSICEQHSLEISRKVERTRKAKQELTKDKVQLKESLKSGTSTATKLSQLNEEAQDLEDQFQAEQDENVELCKSIAVLDANLTKTRSQMSVVEREAEDIRAIWEILKDKVHDAESDLAAAEQTKADWIAKLESRKFELRAANAAASIAARAIDVAAREREVLNHDHSVMIESVNAKKISVQVSENKSRNMENELKTFDSAVKAWKVLIDQLVQDIDEYRNELDIKQTRTRRAVEKSAAKDVQILSFQKSIIEYEGKRRQQQNLLEAVRSDRNMYSKTLLEQKHEMAEFHRVFDALNQSISHMQQELNDKEGAFLSEHLLVEQVDEEIQAIEQRTQKLKKKYDQIHSKVKNESSEISKLSSIIVEADEELQSQTKQYNSVINEERVLSRQLVKRNDELSEVYERLRIHHSMVVKGEAHYNDRKLISVQLEQTQQSLTKELDSMVADRSEIDQFNRSIQQAEKELTREKLKARALEDELKKFMNIHRWRQLQDTNADTFTMIRTIQDLQKSIIAKSDEIVDKDGRIEQKEKLYVDLRRILSRQPGQEAQEQIRMYEAIIKEKKGKHRQMMAELNMHQAKAQEFKYDIDQIRQNLELVKLTYFQRKRRPDKHIGQHGNDDHEFDEDQRTTTSSRATDKDASGHWDNDAYHSGAANDKDLAPGDKDHVEHNHEQEMIKGESI